MCVYRVPYDMTATPQYHFTYLWFTHSTIVAMLVSMGVDVIFYGCAFNCTAHLRIIQKNMTEMIFEEKRDDCDKMAITNEFRANLKQHSIVLDVTKKLNDIFYPVILSQFLLSSLQLCVIAYQLTMVSNFCDCRV